MSFVYFSIARILGDHQHLHNASDISCFIVRIWCIVRARLNLQSCSNQSSPFRVLGLCLSYTFFTITLFSARLAFDNLRQEYPLAFFPPQMILLSSSVISEEADTEEAPYTGQVRRNGFPIGLYSMLTSPEALYLYGKHKRYHAAKNIFATISSNRRNPSLMS